MIIIKGPKIYAEEAVYSDACIVIEDGIIKKIPSIDKKFEEKNAQTFNLSPHWHLIPGMIDMHTHGAAGADFMDGTDAALDTICKTIPSEGTTSFLAATMTAEQKKIESVLQTIAAYTVNQDKTIGAECIGIYLEGPFIAPEKKGAQLASNICAPSIDLFNNLQKKANQLIKLVTLASEEPGAIEFIQHLVKQNVIVSIGHSNADFEQAKEAIAAGCTHSTHLFNAMRPIYQRDPGVVIAILLDDRVDAEIIADGIHLHPGILQLVLKTKGKEKIMLVTDAMRAKYMADGTYTLSGQQVTVKDRQARLADGTLAGSTLKLNDAVHNMIKFTHCTLQDTIQMTAINPAKRLGIFDRKGSIAVDKDADLVVLNEDYQVMLTLCKGEIAYEG